MSNCNHHKNRFEIKLLKNIYDWDFCRNLHIACTDILALWLITYDSAHAQISAGQARASTGDYQGRRCPFAMLGSRCGGAAVFQSLL